MNSHAGVGAFSGAALTHGFQIAFYVLAGMAAVGALIAAVMLESKPAEAEDAQVASDAVPELEAA